MVRRRNRSTSKSRSNKSSTSFPSRCAVYLMTDTMSGDVKIGISNNPELRRSQVERQYNVGSVSLVAVCWFPFRDDAAYYERAFHSRYLFKSSPERGGREWFSLTKGEAEGFLTWMAHSSKQRAFKATSVSTMIAKVPSELFADRRSAFLGGFGMSIVTGIIPAVGYAVSGHELGALAAPTAVGGICVLKTKRGKIVSQIYDKDGKPISPDLPVSELKEMNLWKETRATLPDYSLPPGASLPAQINPLSLS